MRALWATGLGLMGLAMLLWLPQFSDPLLDAILTTLGVVGASVAAAHWRVVGLALLSASWLYFAWDFVTGEAGFDAVIAVGIAIGVCVAFAGARQRSTPVLVAGLTVAGIVQSYWFFAYPGSPYYVGNGLFTLGAILAAVAAWRAGPARHRDAPRPTPETVK